MSARPSEASDQCRVEPESGDPTYDSVTAFIDALARAGVRNVCVSPGARSTPLALVVTRHPGLRAWSHVDERSGAFFALGMAKASHLPVALVCTSGSAAAHFFPALIEAAYAHVPLIVLTADRPPELRDCGAGQTIDQLKLYGSLVKWFAEAGEPAIGAAYFRSLAARAVAAATTAPPGPVHVNFPFREPLVPRADWQAGGVPVSPETPATVFHPPAAMPREATVDALAGALRTARRRLIVCGPNDGDGRLAAAVAELAARTASPILADPLSQVRSGPHDRSRVIAHYDLLLSDEAFAGRVAADLVLRFGPMPRSKALLQYLQRQGGCRQVVVDAPGRWNDPTRTASEIVEADPTATCGALSQRLLGAAADETWCADWLAADRRVALAVSEKLADSDDLFEGKVFAELPAQVPAGALVYVGNSMPVRSLESFWPAGAKRTRFLCNTGANGIDGFVSSGLGAAAVTDGPVVMVTGDLGFYHDLNGLLAVKRYGLRATIVLLNNDGGGIFSFLPQAECGEGFEEFFLTPHGLDFRGAVEMYGARFARVTSRDQFRAELARSMGSDATTVIEVRLNRTRSVELQREIRALVQAANRRG